MIDSSELIDWLNNWLTIVRLKLLTIDLWPLFIHWFIDRLIECRIIKWIDWLIDWDWFVVHSIRLYIEDRNTRKARHNDHKITIIQFKKRHIIWTDWGQKWWNPVLVNVSFFKSLKIIHCYLDLLSFLIKNRGYTRGFAMSVRVLTSSHTFSESKFKKRSSITQSKNITKPLKFHQD